MLNIFFMEIVIFKVFLTKKIYLKNTKKSVAKVQYNSHGRCEFVGSPKKLFDSLIIAKF